MSINKKLITFDLDISSLKEYYSGADWHNAYRDIKNYLRKHDFEHRQGSCYISSKPISISEVNVICYDMNKKFPWFKQCVSEIDVSNVPQKLSLKYIFDCEHKNDNNTITAPDNNDDALYNDYYQRWR